LSGTGEKLKNTGVILPENRGTFLLKSRRRIKDGLGRKEETNYRFGIKAFYMILKKGSKKQN